jgi:hypothetical protein
LLAGDALMHEPASGDFAAQAGGGHAAVGEGEASGDLEAQRH